MEKNKNNEEKVSISSNKNKSTKNVDTYSYKGWLISDSFMKRALAVYGYNFIISLILMIIIWGIMFLFVIIAIGFGTSNSNFFEDLDTFETNGIMIDQAIDTKDTTDKIGDNLLDDSIDMDANDKAEVNKIIKDTLDEVSDMKTD